LNPPISSISVDRAFKAMKSIKTPREINYAQEGIAQMNCLKGIMEYSLEQKKN